jgi:hypothetical protein
MVLPDRISHWIENLPDPSDPSLKPSGRKRSWDEMNNTTTTHQTPERRPRILTPNTSAGDLDNNAETTPRPPRSSAFTTLASVPDLRPSPSASSASSIRSSATHSATGSSQSRESSVEKARAQRGSSKTWLLLGIRWKHRASGPWAVSQRVCGSSLRTCSDAR